MRKCSRLSSRSRISNKRGPHALTDIEKFRKISGLQLNRKKSYGLWIGADAQTQETPGEITWVKPGEYIKILGIHFSATQEASNNEINWRDKINNVIAMIKRSQRRNLGSHEDKCTHA